MSGISQAAEFNFSVAQVVAVMSQRSDIVGNPPASENTELQCRYIALKQKLDYFAYTFVSFGGFCESRLFVIALGVYILTTYIPRGVLNHKPPTIGHRVTDLKAGLLSGNKMGLVTTIIRIFNTRLLPLPFSVNLK